MSAGEIVLALVIGAIMGVLFMAILATVPDPYPRQQGRPATTQEKRVMEYHGVQVMAVTDRGELKLVEVKR